MSRRAREAFRRMVRRLLPLLAVLTIVLVGTASQKKERDYVDYWSDVVETFKMEYDGDVWLWQRLKESYDESPPNPYIVNSWRLETLARLKDTERSRIRAIEQLERIEKENGKE
jgi:hypothetical protein